MERWNNRVVFERQDFMAKLAVLVPAPRAHLTRYHGVLGPAAAWRPLIIPVAAPHDNNNGEITSNVQFSAAQPSTAPAVEAEPPPETLSSVHPRNYTWAELMKR